MDLSRQVVAYGSIDGEHRSQQIEDLYKEEGFIKPLILETPFPSN